MKVTATGAGFGGKSLLMLGNGGTSQEGLKKNSS